MLLQYPKSLRVGLGVCVVSVPLPSGPDTGSDPKEGRVLKKRKKVDAEVNAENLNYLLLQTLKPHTWFQVNSGGKVLGILIDATEPKRVMVYTTERRDKNVMFQ